MKILNLTAVCVAAALLEGCIPESQIVYIPPASRQMAKNQMIHVSQLPSVEVRTAEGNRWIGAFFVNSINGIAINKPIDPGWGPTSMRLSDFYVVPGTYSADYEYLAPRKRTFFTYERAIKSGNVKIVVNPSQTGTTITYFQFLFPDGPPEGFISEPAPK